MSYHLKKLQPKHWKILDLYFEGRTGKEIAAALGRTPRAVSSERAGRVMPIVHEVTVSKSVSSETKPNTTDLRR